MSAWTCQPPTIGVDTNDRIRFDIPKGSALTDDNLFLRNTGAHTYITRDMLHAFRERIDLIDDFLKDLEALD